MVTPEKWVQWGARQGFHVAAQPHVWLSVVGLEVAEIVRLTEIVVRVGAKQIVHHSVGVEQSCPTTVWVRGPAVAGLQCIIIMMIIINNNNNLGRTIR